jgi:hypothetical protein
LPNPKPSSNVQEKQKRTKWTREEYKEVLNAFYSALDCHHSRAKNTTDETYTIWREKVGLEKRPYMDANKLANVRRDILKNNRLTAAEIYEIKQIVSEKNTTSSDQIEEAEVRVTVEYMPPNEIQRCTETIRNSGVESLLVGTEDSFPPSEEHQQESTAGHTNTVLSKLGTLDPNDIDNEFIERNNEEIYIAKDAIIRELSKIKYSDMQDRDNLPKIQSSHKNKKLIRVHDAALKLLLNEIDNDITNINQAIYATAFAAYKGIGTNIKKRKPIKHKEPAWKVKIQKEIDALRGKLSILDELARGVNTNTKKARKIKQIYKFQNNDEILSAKETVKHKMQLKAQRVRRFEKRIKFYRQNRIFQTDAGKFYREIGKTQIEVKTPPPMSEVQELWEKIWSESREHNETAEWIEREEKRMENIPQQEWKDIYVEDIRIALKKAQNWKSPGIDKIPNFWLSNLSASHKPLAKSFSYLMRNPSKPPHGYWKV